MGKDRSVKLGCAVLVAGAMVLASASSNAQVTLKTVVNLAERNSSAVKGADADVRKAQAVLSESKAVFIPSLLFGTGIPAFPEEGFTGSPPTLWSTTVQSLVFSVPQKHFIDSARIGLKAAQSALRDAMEQAALEAATSYVELDGVNQELASVKEQEEFAGRLVDIEQQRTEAGVDSLNQLLEARLTAANIRLKRIHLESRAATLMQQISGLTGLAANTIVTDHGSIPEIPEIKGEVTPRGLAGIESARLASDAKHATAKGDEAFNYFPQLSFFAQYNRNTTLLNDINTFFARPLPANNLSSGFSIQVPLFDMVHRAKARESEADSLRAKVEAEQAQRQNDLQVAQLTGTIRELDTMAEIASLKQQIADEQVKTVTAEIETGNGSSATPQAPPRMGQLALIEQSQKKQESMDAGIELAKARLGLLRALGHMQDWLHELNGK